MGNEVSSIAFVLRHYVPFNEKIILLDRDIGKFQSWVQISRKYAFFEKIGAGTLISYQQVVRKERRMIRFQQIYDMPFILAATNILFLHHLLEVCSFFLPLEGYDSSAIFDLLLFVYHLDDELLTVHRQKLLLFRLYALLGLYPEHVTFHNASFYLWVTCPLKELMTQHVGLPIERLLDIWLINCIRSHPMVSSFKTIRFLDEVRVP